MIPEGKSAQQFFITAAPWVAETVRDFHLRTTAKEKQTSQSVSLIVKEKDALAGATP